MERTKFSDGYRGFMLNYKKSPACAGDEFQRVSASRYARSNTLKLAIVESYRHNATGQIGKIMADFIKTDSSNSEVGKAVAASDEKIGNLDVVKIDNDTVAVLQFEILKSVSGNESNYFAYKVSFKNIDDGDDINQSDNSTIDARNETDNQTNETNVTIPFISNETGKNATNATNETDNTTNETNETDNETNETNETNVTNVTNDTNLTNETNSTLLKDLYDYMNSVANALFAAWQPLIDTTVRNALMLFTALTTLGETFENFLLELNNLITGVGKLLSMLESVFKELTGLMKLLGVLLASIQQILNFLMSLLNFISGLISSIIGLIQYLIGLLYSLIGFITDLLNQLAALVQAILDFLKSIGNSIAQIIENGALLIGLFVLIALGAFIYDRKRN